MFDDVMNTTAPKDNKYTSKYSYYIYLIKIFLKNVDIKIEMSTS